MRPDSNTAARPHPLAPAEGTDAKWWLGQPSGATDAVESARSPCPCDLDPVRTCPPGDAGEAIATDPRPLPVPINRLLGQQQKPPRSQGTRGGALRVHGGNVEIG